MTTIFPQKANQFNSPIKDGAIDASMVIESLRTGYISHINVDQMDWIGENLLD